MRSAEGYERLCGLVDGRPGPPMGGSVRKRGSRLESGVSVGPHSGHSSLIFNGVYGSALSRRDRTRTVVNCVGALWVEAESLVVKQATGRENESRGTVYE